ncbi:uncharacterized protein BDV14DRAFT_193313 [Aspergillus stella-maris]|uniref:uncharacterized protein n=1 Tax=Aspergillus stella-maris TaxID=1810926 RepID=UPI003CCDFBB5
MAPRADAFDLYSLIPFAEDFRSRAEERRCFYSSESACQVTWIDVDTAGVVGESRLCSLAELRAHRNRHCPQGNGLRILSINQRNSWRPLNVTRDMFEEVVDIAGASSDLLELPLSFFQKSNPLEEGFNSAPVFRLHANSIEIVYIIKYAFEKPLEEKGKDPWVLRQTGVYHKYDFTTKNSTLIFLNPTQQCQFQTRLMNLVRLQEQQAQLIQNPLLVHSILFGTFCAAWRDYLKHLESRILSIGNTTVAAEIDKPLRVNHESLTAVRSTENRCLVLHPIFRSLEKTCDVLHQANATLAGAGTTEDHALEAMKQLLNNYSASVSAYAQAAWSLQNRTSRIACHITDTLSFKDAYIAKRQTEFMLRDSTTVRVITVVTLIYLPSTFMATLLGMNSFFEMDENRRIVVAPQFWIYVVCAIPLTAATLCYWWYFQRSKQRKEPSAADALMV